MSLFSRRAAPTQAQGLRWYQREAVDSVHRLLGTGVPWAPPDDEPVRSCLIVAATGTGKTQMFGGFAHEVQGNVLILAHRDELVQQARVRLEEITGEHVDIEQGEWTCNHSTRIVVGSVQTVLQPHRLARLGKDRFQYVVCDEAHHYVENSFARPLEYFADAKILGVTATPDRGDEKALGQSFDEVAYLFDIEQAIDAGYLVPVLGKRVYLQEIDLEGVGKSGKDLAAGQLDERMVKAVEGIVAKTLELEPERQGIAFFPGVQSAELAAQRFNARAPGSACFISGSTDPFERKQLVADFKRGRYRYLCNCQVATEGFDAPSTSCIIIGRPTLSRALFAQMVGRGTRTEPGCIEGLDAPAEGAERRAAIDWSGKPDLVVLDFVGNAGKHSLATVEDVLGGKYSEEEVALAKKKTEGGAVNVSEALRQARAEIAALAQRIQARQIKATTQDVDLFGYMDPEDDTDQGAEVGRRFGFKPPTDKQKEALRKLGVSQETIDNVSKKTASGMLDRLFKENGRRLDAGLASLGMLRVLKKYGVTEQNISRARAEAALNYLSQKGWGREKIDNHALERIIHYERQAGEDG